MKSIRISIDGMSCGHCVAAVRRALTAVDGATVHDVALGRADVTYDPERIGEGGILETISESGYIPRGVVSGVDGQ